MDTRLITEKVCSVVEFFFFTVHIFFYNSISVVLVSTLEFILLFLLSIKRREDEVSLPAASLSI